MTTYQPPNITYYRGYAILKVGPNRYDLWGPRGVKSRLNPSGRLFVDRYIILRHARERVDQRLSGIR